MTPGSAPAPPGIRRLPPEIDPRRPATRPPARRRTPAPRRPPRLIGWVAALLSLAVLVVSAGGWVAYRYFDGRIAHISLAFAHGYRRPAAAAAGQNFLLVGSDSRADGQFQVKGAGAIAGQRSDTTILAHLAPDGTTTLVSLPRDTWLRVPDYRDGQGTDHPAHLAKINSAISEGGPPLLVETVETLTGVRVDHYLQVDFGGFQKMTQAVGGVDVCIRRSSFVESSPDPQEGHYGPATNIDDPVSGFRGHDGLNHLAGVQALLFVRQRHGLPGGDLDRIKRQQAFLAAVFHKALSSGTLLNPQKLGPFLSAATASLTTDSHTGLTDLRTLAARLRGLSSSAVRFATIPTYAPADNTSGAYGGQAVLRYDPLALRRFLAGLGLVKPVAAAPTAPAAAARRKPSVAAPLTVPASQVSVQVENGTSTSGLGSQVRRELAARGFSALGPHNAGSGHATTLVRYGSGMQAAARTLAAAVPGSALVSDPSLTGSTLVLVLGENYAGLSGSTTSGRATPATAAPAAPTPPAASTAASPDLACTY